MNIIILLTLLIFCLFLFFPVILTPADLWYHSGFPRYRHLTVFVMRTYEETQIARPPSSSQKELQWDCTEEEILSATLSPPLKSFQSQIFDAGNFLCWKFCYLPAGEYTDPEASAGCVRYKRRICSFTSFTNLATFNFETLSYEKLMRNKYGSLEV